MPRQMRSPSQLRLAGQIERQVSEEVCKLAQKGAIRPVQAVIPFTVEASRADREASIRRSVQAGSEGSDPTGSGSARPVPQLYICSPQEGWVTEASGEPQASQHFCAEATLQDGRDTDSQGPAEKGRFYGVNRPEGCLPVSPSDRDPSEVLEISMAREAL